MFSNIAVICCMVIISCTSTVACIALIWSSFVRVVGTLFVRGYLIGSRRKDSRRWCCWPVLMLTREGTHKSEGKRNRQYYWCVVIHCWSSSFGCRQPFRFLLNNSASELYDHFTNHLKWASLEPRPHGSEHEEEPASSTRSPGVLDEQQLFLPGSGITKKLYSFRYIFCG